MNINGTNYEVKFKRSLTPVNFFQHGRPAKANRMRTEASLVSPDGDTIATAFVTQYHKDKYNRRLANEKAFAKLADRFNGETRVSLLKQFFSKPESNV